MSSLQPFDPSDLFKAQNINLDPFTENFPLYFYLEYLIFHPNYFFKSTETTSYESTGNTRNKRISGYIMGKVEGSQEYHSHISAVTVDKQYRRIKISSDVLLDCFRNISDYISKVKFIDLFVKCDNALALKLYEKLGYKVYRRVVGYYDFHGLQNLKRRDDDKLDAFDMRFSLGRDKGESLKNGGKNNRCLADDVTFT